MPIQLSAILHNYQPFRDWWDVTYIPLSKRHNGQISQRNLIPFPDGRPADDWNKGITEECYRICAKGGALTSLPFNVGPSLLKDLWINQRDVYDAIIQSDKTSQERFHGHGNAVAQASPNHAIVPLANGDKPIHVMWGIKEFEKHFERYPEGIWLPETAVDKETLSVLADHKIKFVVLAPKQAYRVRPINGAENSWQSVEWGNIDTSKPYKVKLDNEKDIAVFFYDKYFSHELGFRETHDWVYQSSENFIHRWLGVNGDFKHFGLDGETFGHHKKGKADLLVGAVNLINQKKYDAEFVNYGLFLEKNPPQMEVEIKKSAWSCEHELGRWGQEVKVKKEHNGHRWEEDINCRCGSLGSEWRIQMRKAFDDLAERIDDIYLRYAPKYFKNSEKALKDYAQVTSNSMLFYDFFQIHGKENLSYKDIEDAYKLMEMEKFKIYMVTSCGWFHDYLGRIEPFTNFICANSAIRLAKYFKPGSSIEEGFLSILSDDTRFQKPTSYKEDSLRVYNQAKEANNGFFQALAA